MLKKHSLVQRCQIVAKGKDAILSDLKTANATQKMSKYHGEIVRTSDGDVDLSAEMSKHPDALWIRVKAIEADRENDNGDYFSREEILKSYKTFEGCPVFTNHENNKIEAAKGKVVLAEWNEDDGSVYCTMFIDREAYPGLCRAIEQGYATDVSMGTQVDYSECSICSNRSSTAAKYCEHVKSMKGRNVEGKKVFEKNYGLKFIELSVVTDGACKDCTIREILDPEQVLNSGLSVAANVVANSSADMVKVSDNPKDKPNATVQVLSAIKSAILEKNSGQDELRKLNEAMSSIEEVCRSMLDQRQYLDLEYLSKVADVLADLQHVTDELVDQGYGSVGPQGAQQQPNMQSQIPPLPTGTEQVPAPVETGSPAGVGSVTEPSLATVKVRRMIFSNKLKDLTALVRKICEEATSSQGEQKVNPQETIKKLAKVWSNPSVRDFKTELSEGDLKVVVGGQEVYGLRGGTKVASIKIADLDDDIKDMIKKDPREAATHMIEALKTKVASMSSMEKVAEKAPTDSKQQLEQTMEAQLRDNSPTMHPRTNEVHQSITEKQLNKKTDNYDKHMRSEKPVEVITEKQLKQPNYDDGLGHERQDKNNAHEETMEVQLRDTGIKGNETPAASDRPWSAGVSEHNQATTEKQLEEWKKQDKGHSPEHESTEKQLADQGGMWGRRLGSKEDAKKAIFATIQALAKTAVATGATPDEMLAIASQMTSSPAMTIAAQKLADKLAGQKDERHDMFRRASFHGKKLTASTHEVEDYMLGSLSDAGMSSEVGLQVLANIVSLPNTTESIANAIKEISNKKESTNKKIDFLKEAMAEMDSEEQVNVILKAIDVKEKPENKEAFAKASFEAAVKIAADNSVKVTKQVHVSLEGETIRVSLAGRKMNEEEIKAHTASKKNSIEARKAARQEKVAQMPAGGGMPAAPGGNPMGGGGTTMPTPMPGDPAAAGPEVSSLGGAGEEMPEDNMEDKGGEVSPPGSKCPACGSDDVNVKSGEFTCENCGASGEFSVNILIKNYPDTIKEKGPHQQEEGSPAEDNAGMGDMLGGPGMDMPQVGVAASFKVTPEMVKKANNKPIGSYCPHCSSEKVKVAFKSGTGRGECESCGGKYAIDMFVNEKKDLFARIEWTDRNMEKLAKSEGESKKVKLSKALESKGLSSKFAKSDLKGKAAIIAELRDNKLI